MRFMVSFSFLALFASCQSAPTSESAQSVPESGTPASAGQIHGDLRQVMRGILFTNANVIFAAQDKLDVKQANDPSTATDPLASTYGGWDAVENSGIALAEAANLIMVPGRKCANGRAVPTENEDWKKFTQELRDAGMNAYKAAQSKNPEKIVEVAGVMTEACLHCHEKYREKPNGDVDRCM